MEVAGSAVGIASLGIQICQGLLSYYNDWKSYNSDVSSAYDSIDDLSRTLVSIKASLDSDEFGEEKKGRVKRCIHSCEDSLVKLSQKSQKLRKHGQPEGLREKAWKELQRAWYPFRASTLVRLQEIVADARERLELAVQVLQLDASATSQRILKSVAADTSNLVNHTVAIATSVAHVSAQTQQVLDLQQSDQFQKIIAWLSPPKPSTSHQAARQLHEPHTGTWLLQACRYQRWKAGDIKHLWLYGKVGCGKTVLFSTVVEDIRVYCKSRKNTMHTAFYFTFSDNRKQSYEDLLLSLLDQLGWDEPGKSMLMQAYEKPNAGVPGVDELEKIVLGCFQSYDELFLLLDALDECPESNEARQNVLDGLERLVQGAPSTKVFVTSREVRSVGESMQALGAVVLPVTSRLVNEDIQRYTSTHLASDPKLSKLDVTTKNLIEDKISRQADGMFRWAYCQLHELKKLKSTRPSHVREALSDLPETLDKTYERMLTAIEKRSRKDALVLFRWLAFARSPLSLGELAEARIIDPAGDGSVDMDDRGGIEDVLEILSGLAIVETASGDGAEHTKTLKRPLSDLDVTDWNVESYQHLDRDSKVKLAHFSVKEYLVSDRIFNSEAAGYALNEGHAHAFLGQSCFKYILHCYHNSTFLHPHDDADHPLCKYAMSFGIGHQRSAEDLLENQYDSGQFQIQVLNDNLAIAKRLWPSMPLGRLARSCDSFPSSILWKQAVPHLHLASLLALKHTVRILLANSREFDIDQEAVVSLLLMPGRSQTALHCAVYSNSIGIVDMLLDNGADIEVGANSEKGTPLYLASSLGKLPVVEQLISRGANVNAKGGHGGQPLQAACGRGHVDVAVKLLAFGADVDAAGGYDGSALCGAANRGNQTLVNLLLDYGAKINHRVQHSWTALHVASEQGNENIVKLLLRRKADITAKTEDGSSALELAIVRMRKGVVKLLLQHGANNLVDQCCLLDALDLVEQSWHNMCEDWEYTDDGDIAHFAQTRECMEDIKQLLTQYSALQVLR